EQPAEELPPDEWLADLSGFSPINIRNVSIKCGNCDKYQTLSHFARRGEWNVYTYECENAVCDAAVTRTHIEVPAELDEFANRDPNWRGGKIHAGAHTS
ncbi:MAG: hypothetical protein AAF657_38365, partial [Acidobacteriota bacterium]